MKHFTLLALTSVFMMIPAIAEAQGKIQVSVAKFADESLLSHCKETPGARFHADDLVRAQMINQLMGLDRFQVQEREIRPMRPQHAISGTITRYDVCQEGRGQAVNLEIVVKVTSGNGLVRTFTSQAIVSNTAMNVAPAQAIRMATGEVIRHIDDSVSRYSQARLPIRRPARRVVADNEMLIKLYPKKH